MFSRFAFSLVILAGCSASSSDTANGDPNAPPPDDPGAQPPPASGPTEPDFGPEGQPTCPSAHFCLEFPSVTASTLHGLAVTAAGGVWAVGDGGALLHSKSAGKAWSRVEAPKQTLRAVAASGARVIAVGDEGTILRLEGTTWNADPIDGKPTLTGVWGAATDDFWAVGYTSEHGVVLHFDGKTWSHVADDKLPAIFDVNGSSPSDVWIGGGSMDSLALFHLDGATWTAAKDPIAMSRQVEGPIAHVAVLGKNDVVVATDGPNFSNLLHFDGSTWKDEADLLYQRVAGFARAKDGTLWAATDPPQVRTKGKWSEASTVGPIGASVEAIAFAQGATIVAGANGLLGRTDGGLSGPYGGIMQAKAVAGGNVLLTPNRVIASDGNGAYRTLFDAPYAMWMGANAIDDVAVISFYSGTDANDPNREFAAYRWDGSHARTVVDESAYEKMVTPLGYTANGELWYDVLTFPTGGTGTTTSRVLRLGKTATSPVELLCAGKSLEASAIYTDGKDTLVRTDGHMFHVDASGTCAELTGTDQFFYWSNDDLVDGTGYSDIWAVENDSSTSSLRHWDGKKVTSAATIPKNVCGMRWFGPKDIWFTPCEEATELLHYDGSKTSSIDIGQKVSGAKIWGTDAAHLWIGDYAGTVLRYRP